MHRVEVDWRLQCLCVRSALFLSSLNEKAQWEVVIIKCSGRHQFDIISWWLFLFPFAVRASSDETKGVVSFKSTWRLLGGDWFEDVWAIKLFLPKKKHEFINLSGNCLRELEQLRNWIRSPTRSPLCFNFASHFRTVFHKLSSKCLQ